MIVSTTLNETLSKRFANLLKLYNLQMEDTYEPCLTALGGCQQLINRSLIEPSDTQTDKMDKTFLSLPVSFIY